MTHTRRRRVHPQYTLDDERGVVRLARRGRRRERRVRGEPRAAVPLVPVRVAVPEVDVRNRHGHAVRRRRGHVAEEVGRVRVQAVQRAGVT